MDPRPLPPSAEGLETDRVAELYPPLTATTVQALPSEMRPREEMRRRGVHNVADEMLLAILLRSGTRGKNVIELARDILRKSNGLSNLAKASPEEIQALRIPGLGPIKAMELAAALALGRRVAELGPSAEQIPVREPVAVWRLLEPQAQHLKQEIFWALLLNTKHVLIGQPVEVTQGLLDNSPIHAREVFSVAIRYSAAAVIVAHNHPSGDPTPSPEDIRITRRLVEAAKVVDVRLLDHVIIGRAKDGQPGFVSLREQGHVAF